MRARRFLLTVHLGLLAAISFGATASLAQTVTNEIDKLLASDGDDNDLFGYAVAIEETGATETVVAGARLRDEPDRLNVNRRAQVHGSERRRGRSGCPPR